MLTASYKLGKKGILSVNSLFLDVYYYGKQNLLNYLLANCVYQPEILEINFLPLMESLKRTVYWHCHIFLVSLFMSIGKLSGRTQYTPLNLQTIKPPVCLIFKFCNSERQTCFIQNRKMCYNVLLFVYTRHCTDT